MVSALKLLGTSIDRAWNLEDETVAKAGLQRTIDTSYPWLWNQEDFPRRAVITEWFYQPLKGQPRFVDVSRLRSLATCEWVTMCTNTIIEEVAQVPWEIVPKDPDLQESPPERLQTEIDEVEDFFNNPNDNKGETINTILRAFTRDSLELDAGTLVKGFSEKSYDRSGSSYKLKPEGQRDLAELWARDGGTFLKDIDIYGVENAYWQYSWNNPAATPEAFDVDEIVYAIRNPRSYSPYGWAETQSCETILNLLINSVFSNATMFQEYAVPSGIVSFTGTEEEEQRLRAYMRTEIKGRFHKVAVLNKDAKFVPLAYTAKDMDFLEGQKWFGRMVWAIYKLTPTELGYQDEIRETGKAMSQQSSIHKRKAVVPLLRLIEQTMNEQILNEFSTDIIFRFNYADKEEQYAEAQLDMECIGSGLMTINEYRQKHKIGDKVAWGDQPLQITLGKMQSEAGLGLGRGEGFARQPEKPGRQALREMTAEEKSLIQVSNLGNIKTLDVEGSAPVYAINRKTGQATQIFDSTIPAKMKKVSKHPTVYRGSVKAEQNLHQKLKRILLDYRDKKLSYEEAIQKGIQAIDENQAVIHEIARKKASKDLGLDIVELSPEMSSRLKTFRDETVGSFQKILEDSKKKFKQVDDQNGKWVTLDNGQHIFIREGESFDDAIKRLDKGEDGKAGKPKTADKTTPQFKTVDDVKKALATQPRDPFNKSFDSEKYNDEIGDKYAKARDGLKMHGPNFLEPDEKQALTEANERSKKYLANTSSVWRATRPDYSGHMYREINNGSMDTSIKDRPVCMTLDPRVGGLYFGGYSQGSIMWEIDPQKVDGIKTMEYVFDKNEDIKGGSEKAYKYNVYYHEEREVRAPEVPLSAIKNAYYMIKPPGEFKGQQSQHDYDVALNDFLRLKKSYPKIPFKPLHIDENLFGG